MSDASSNFWITPEGIQVEEILSLYEAAWGNLSPNSSLPLIAAYLAKFTGTDEAKRILDQELQESEKQLQKKYPCLPAANTTIDYTKPPGNVPTQGNQSFPIIDGYNIQEELGSGGMGVVYKAKQNSLDRWVALKVMNASNNDNDRFRSEAKIVARFQHDNIVRIYEIGTTYNGALYLSLEFVVGGTLAEKVKLQPLGPVEAAKILEVLARAVHVAHLAGVIHRDLKPDNILLTAGGIPKITDFGLARNLSAPGQTLAGQIMGTPSYMPPEQACGKEIDGHADVYSLGAILYELLTGRPPFQGANNGEILDKVRHGTPTSPRQGKPDIPVDLETICMKCLEKDQDNRYATAEKLAEDLHRFQNGNPIEARPERSLLLSRRGLIKTVVSLGVLAFAGKAWLSTPPDQTDVLGQMLEDWKRIEYLWLKPENEIQKLSVQIGRMLQNVKILQAGKRNNAALAYLVGRFCADLTNSIWRLKGKRGKTQIDILLEEADKCAGIIKPSYPAGYSAIQASRHNELGTPAWSEPDKILDPAALTVEHHYYSEAMKFAVKAAEINPDQFGINGQDTIDHILSEAHIYTLGNEFEKAEYQFKKAGERIRPHHHHLRASHTTFSGMLAARQEKPPQAIDLLRKGILEFTQHLRTEEHHIIAAIRMHLRQLKDPQLNTFEQDRIVLGRSPIRASEFVNLEEVFRIHCIPWEGIP